MLGTLMGKNIVFSERPLWDQKLPSEQELEVTSGLGAGTAQVERTSHAKALGQEKKLPLRNAGAFQENRSGGWKWGGGRRQTELAAWDVLV